ncbi:MAG: hypothetical protein MJ204_09455 [Bacteroidales bacterium]|nr:hypothetical protein [Bacteroidales bacterium]
MGKISPIKERILYFIENKGITKLDFCERTGISYANLKGKSLESEIGGSQIAEILTKYVEISPDWLILGKGSMHRNNVVLADNNDCCKSCKLIEALKCTISTQEAFLASQKGQINDLRKLLSL